MLVVYAFDFFCLISFRLILSLFLFFLNGFNPNNINTYKKSNQILKKQNFLLKRTQCSYHLLHEWRKQRTELQTTTKIKKITKNLRCRKSHKTTKKFTKEINNKQIE